MIVRRFVMFGLVALAAAGNVSAQPSLGYTNTPVIPGTPWRVHDGARPQPRIVTPGARFSQLAAPPSDATVLFDGKNLASWENLSGGPAAWKIGHGCLEVVPHAGSIRTTNTFADFQLHLEFAAPATVRGHGQGRGNSGVIINGLYEVQVLDSFNNPTYPDGQAGAIYGQAPPLVNASKAPGKWQSYDLIFESPRWDAGSNLVKKANVTVIHNGVVLHHKRELLGETDGNAGLPHKSLAAYLAPHPPEMFIELQDHGDPVRYRNIWIRALGNYDQP